MAIGIEKFTSSLVGISGALIHLFGGKALVQGVILASAEGCAVRVENGCNAINVTILLWAAILVYPAAWPEKLKGITAGTLILHAINLLRIISLYYLGRYNQAWFDFAHLYLWESLIAKNAVQFKPRVSLLNLKRVNTFLEAETSAGPLRARFVILALGRRGTPRSTSVDSRSKGVGRGP